MGQVRRVPAGALDEPLQGFGLAQAQVVLGAAARAGQVDVLHVARSVVLGPAFEVCVPKHADLFQGRKRPIDRGRVHGGEPALDPAGHVLGQDVPRRAQHLLDDRVTLRGDPEPVLAEHSDDAGGLVHAASLMQRRCRCPKGAVRTYDGGSRRGAR